MRRIGFTRNTDGITPESYLACLVLHPANLKELFLEMGLCRRTTSLCVG